MGQLRQRYKRPVPRGPQRPRPDPWAMLVMPVTSAVETLYLRDLALDQVLRRCQGREEEGGEREREKDLRLLVRRLL